MKILLSAITLVLLIGYSAYSNAMQSGFLYEQTLNSDNVSFNVSQAFWATQSLSYAPGGVTFTYPSGLFTNPPTVTIGVQGVSLPTGTTIVSPIVIANAATSTTVQVFVGDILLGILEAASGEVTVHIRATGT